MDNMEQYLAIVAVLWLDGVFGIWAGIKREGFKTYKALKITRNTAVVVIVPFMVLQLISALKNASMAGLIKMEVFNKILDRIDKHKGFRD